MKSSQTIQNPYLKQNNTWQSYAQLSDQKIKDYALPHSKLQGICWKIIESNLLAVPTISTTKLLNDKSSLLSIALMTSKASEKKNKKLSHANSQALLRGEEEWPCFYFFNESAYSSSTWLCIIDMKAFIKYHTSKITFFRHLQRMPHLYK